MLTGNWSMFLGTDGSLAWLHRCSLVNSPLNTMSRSHNGMPIFYEFQIQFVEPIIRKTHPVANLQSCTDRIRNLFQSDMDEEDSWYTITLAIVHQDNPAVFRPKGISPVVVHSFP